jgi:hypothetical protein
MAMVIASPGDLSNLGDYLAPLAVAVVAFLASASSL